MTTFIEVTTRNDEALLLLNAAAIERIVPGTNGCKIVFIGGVEARDPRSLMVTDSYDVLRNRLLTAL